MIKSMQNYPACKELSTHAKSLDQHVHEVLVLQEYLVIQNVTFLVGISQVLFMLIWNLYENLNLQSSDF